MKHIVLPSYSIRAGADLHGKVSIFGAVEAKADFTAVWDTTKTSAGSSAINQVRLPLISTGVYDFVVDWGDGNQDTITTWNQAETTHTYITPGIYTVRITGQIEGFRFNNGGDILKLHNVSGWGPLKLISDAWFYGCANFTSDANDWPLVDTSSFSRAFMGCTLFNGDVSNWNTSGVSNMASMFRGTTAFNQDIGGWDVSAVTDMDLMFQSSGLSNTNYDNILVGWTGWTSGAATKSLQNSVPFHAGSAKYSSGDPADARAWLVDTILNGGKAWTITDGGPI